MKQFSLPGDNRSIALFLILTCVLTTPFWALAIATGDSAGGRGAYSVGIMWGPGAAALFTCWLRQRSVAGLGWKWGEKRWQLLSYTWPLAVCVVVYGLICVLGLGSFPNPVGVSSIRTSLAWPNAGQWTVVSGWFLLLATTGEIRGIASALGEELGWRGFLAPVLCRRLGFTQGALLTGAIWAVWHFPIIFFSNYDSATPWWFSTPCFVIEVLSLSVIMAWIRLKSGSLWTGAIAHASINLFNQGYFAPLTAPRGHITAYFVDESGAGLPIVLLVTAIFFWTKRRKVALIKMPQGTSQESTDAPRHTV
ncbi:CPBP family intramembrane glutamic endopeptidase [Sphingomonas sp. OK281]|uniref:CPBP family intramembrane glutamic endopeptidase n=1 Tax=Sphingomonas sp. OK281 TaxID=1881067 RepID=UPI0008DFF089|nr:type II CAAX endopeptidase family protein [Sphingomonas sp. OK281]SFO33318.1 Membrane protease YdiL, CAAX protease family [Sphingomonas sp. OK281]